MAALAARELLHRDGPSGIYFIGDEPVDFAHFGDGHRMKFCQMLLAREIFVPVDGPPMALPPFVMP